MNDMARVESDDDDALDLLSSWLTEKADILPSQNRYIIVRDTYWTAIFPTRPAFLCGAVRVLGSEEGELGSGFRN